MRPYATLRAVGGLNATMPDLTITDSTDATVAALISATGQVGVANGGVALPPQYWFKVNGNGDTTDNGLQAAKGSAPAAGDRFRANLLGGVSYIGLGL